MKKYSYLKGWANMKEYKYLEEWRKRKNKITRYSIIIFIILSIILVSLSAFKNNIPEFVFYLGMFIVLILMIVLITLYISASKCPRCGYYFGKHGFLLKNCPRCGLKHEQ